MKLDLVAAESALVVELEHRWGAVCRVRERDHFRAADVRAARREPFGGSRCAFALDGFPERRIARKDVDVLAARRLILDLVRYEVG
jgi:hypothetical protein